MKVVLVFFCFLFMSIVAANDVVVDVEPKEALVNESFFVTFRIKTSDSEEPYISFTPNGASVLGKRSQGLSISTVVINGKFTTTKEQAIVYELLAERSGDIYLRDISVELSGKVSKVKDVKVTVLSEPRRVPDAFIEAEASKTRVYLGEGIDVKYYIYFKTSISANDVKEFPKLNKFIKRFHQVNSPVETVQYKGQVLRRILAYSARVYPEKTGTAILDPLKINVQTIESAYSAYGFGNQRAVTKDLASQRVEVEVLPLPTENVPANFTGLVGEHEFKLIMPKSKYVVNEPIEYKLEVKGFGALENMEAPDLYAHQNLEKFDTRSELNEINRQEAKKTFEYTLLARGPLEINKRDFSLSYFDPSTQSYVSKKIEVPELVVGGGATASENNDQAQSAQNKQDETIGSLINSISKTPIIKNAIGLIGPNFNRNSNLTNNWIVVANIIVGFIVFVLGVFVLKKELSSYQRGSSYQADLNKLKSKGLSYEPLYRVLSGLDKTNKMANGGCSVVNIIDESPLSNEAKNYFKLALDLTGNGQFTSQGISATKMKYEAKYFKEVVKNL